MKREKDDIERYRNGSMTEAERHAMEKKALSDPFLSDALEGAEQISADNFSKDLDSINGKFQKSKFGFTPLRIAAGVLILVATGVMLYYINLPETQPLALEKSATGPNSTEQADSASLLTLGVEDKTKDQEQPAPKAREKSLLLADEKRRKEEIKPTPGISQAEVKNDKESVTPGSVKEKEIVEEMAEEKVAVGEPVQSAPLSTQGAGLSSKKEISSADLSKNDRATRSAKSVSGKIYNAFHFAGKVSSVEDGQPVAGANVLIKGTQRGSTTDDNGDFSLSLNDATQPLVISSIGLNTQEVIPENTSAQDIRLTENVSQPIEVVVTESPVDPVAAHEPVVKNAAPSGGLKQYNVYLENNLHFPLEALKDKIKGKVLVQFSISPTGQLSDFKVLRSLRRDCDDEVMRLIKEGPTWTPTIRDNISVQSEVKVKVKFDPDKAKR